MKKKKIVLEIVGKAIEKYGFVYDKEESTNGIWMFVKEQNSIKQRLYIQEHRFQKGLFLRFETSAWGVPMVDANYLVPKGKYRNCLGVWSYEDESSFRNVMEEFVEIIEKYGLEKLKEMSIEEKVIPTNEMGKQLLESHEKLSQSFIKEYQLDMETQSINEVLKWFEIIAEIMSQTKGKSYESIQGKLVEISAFLGEQLRKEVGGSWVQGNDARNVFLNGLNCYLITRYWVLQNVIEAWKKQSVERLRQEYLFLLDSKLPMEVEKMEILQKKWIEISNIQ